MIIITSDAQKYKKWIIDYMSWFPVNLCENNQHISHQVIFRCFGDFDEISRRHQYFLFQCNIIPLKLDSKGASDQKVLLTKKAFLIKSRAASA